MLAVAWRSKDNQDQASRRGDTARGMGVVRETDPSREREEALPESNCGEIIEHLSPLTFGDTVDRLRRGIAEAGLTLFVAIDHAAGAREAGLAMPAATVLIYGAAKGGTPVMLAAPNAALDLPLRVLIREREDGRTAIVFHPAATMLRVHGVPAELAARLEPAQNLLLIPSSSG